MFKTLFTLSDSWVIDLFIHIPFAVVLAALFFGIMYGVSRAEQKARVVKERSRIQQTLIYAATIPLLAVYVLYFISQFAYFTSAFDSILPSGFTYADYARQGFFELCFVACLNGGIVALLHFCTRRNDNGGVRLGQKLLVFIYCLFTLLLIATSISRMMLYIAEYGYTPKRIYTSVFMLLLAVLFILIILRYVFSKVNVALFTFAAAVALFSVVAFGDIDAFCAKSNVELYTEGKFDTVDIVAFHDLSPTAAEYAIPLLECGDAKLEESTRVYLKTVRDNLLEKKPILTSPASARVLELLEKLDLESK